MSYKLETSFATSQQICEHNLQAIWYRLQIKDIPPGGNLINVSPHLGAVVTVNAAVLLLSAAGKPIWLQEQQAAPGSDNPLRSLVVDKQLVLQADMVML